MKQTSNYQLNQWEKTDRILMEDFNGDNAKVDAALAEQSTALAEQAAQLVKLGNCEVYYGSYTGTGSGATALTFPHKPLFITIMGDNIWLCAVQGAPVSHCRNGGTGCGNSTATWSGNTVSLATRTESMTYQCNEKGSVYYVIAVMDVAQ